VAAQVPCSARLSKSICAVCGSATSPA
jgi:hypothetical protein